VRTLNRYLLATFLTTCAVSLVVLTFVLTLGGLFKITDLLARGAPWRPILTIFACGVPAALAFAIPMSALVSALLVFSRLSADGEIAAMKACGISMWQIASRPLLAAALLSGFCFFVNSELAPRGHYGQRAAILRLGRETPVELLEEGRFIQDFEGLTLYLGRRKGSVLRNIRVYDLRRPGVKREIRAASGTVRTTPEGDLVLDLRDVRVDPLLDDRPGPAFCERWPVTIPQALRTHGYRRREDDFSNLEIARGVANPRSLYPNLNAEDLSRQRSVLLVELNKRIVLAISCFSFVWLGIPLGTRTHRRESSIGIGISLILVANFYLFIITGEALDERAELYPHLILWIPVALSLLLGWRLLQRAN
jgi:lipopolysaccharide export system permease protein